MEVVATLWFHWRWFQLRNCSGHSCGSVIVMEMFVAVKSVSLILCLCREDGEFDVSELGNRSCVTRFIKKLLSIVSCFFSLFFSVCVCMFAVF